MSQSDLADLFDIAAASQARDGMLLAASAETESSVMVPPRAGVSGTSVVSRPCAQPSSRPTASR